MKGKGTPSRAALALLVAAGIALAGCASNPATGKRQLNLYSEAQEIALGREADGQITAELGLVDDAELTAWVAGIGQRLAAKSERPNLPWSFKVIDDPAVNAFALPGGYVYVTRGILAHMRTEAELASVLGHEIAHVTAQHGVNQMSKQQVAMGGLLVGMIAVPELARAADLAQAGLGLLFLKYGRDDERQADDLGLRYMVNTGYDTREMARMFEVLGSVGEIAGAGRLPSWLSSHPEPAQRRERTVRLIAERGYPPGEVAADRLLRETAGLVFGADPREGYFEKDVFYHPGLAFQVEMPSGWTRVNERSRLAALHPEKLAMVELRLAREPDAARAAEAFLGQQGLTAGRPARLRVNGLQAVAAPFEVARQGGSSLAGRAVFVEHGGQVFRLLGLAPSDQVERVRGTVSSFLEGFAPLADRARLEAQPQRLEIVTLPRAMSFDEFRRLYPSDADPRVLALINGVEAPAEILPAGTLLKRVAGPWVGDRPRWE